ncbi:MAG: SDR family oxidoreductase [Coriobacteriales bacterium]|jgi:NAD(P)-dependent dehydrogenase (short-subunit alcohol dehydrogenase family)|nr:SDR family oxidoreductase [Coriobacteriales bacterium]
MAGRIEGKVALVTGAGNGMGLETVKRFVEEGARVVAADIRADDLEQWQGVDGVVPIVADVMQQSDIDKMMAAAIQNFGELEVVCNIAGMNDLSYPLLDTDDERWDRILDLDLKAPFRICRAAVPLMIERGGGSIINIGSYAALRGNHGPSYTAAKAGLAGLTKSIAFGYVENNVRCNIIHPGGMRTNIGEHSGGAYHPAQAKLSKICAAMPVMCYADPREIANACLFLASDDAKLITGAELSVDLGMSVC